MANVRRKKTVPSAKRTGAKRAAPTQAGSKPVWKWLLIGVGVLAVVGLVLVMVRDLEPVNTDRPDGVRQVAVGDPRHIEGPIGYLEAVPAGGPHNPTPLQCGFYDGVIATENAVHSLEHGAVWVTFRRPIDADSLDKLEGMADDRFKLIVSEVPDQDTSLMATAWGFQLDLDSVNDGRLEQFINSFTSATSAPEPQAGC